LNEKENLINESKVGEQINDTRVEYTFLYKNAVDMNCFTRKILMLILPFSAAIVIFWGGSVISQSLFISQKLHYISLIFIALTLYIPALIFHDFCPLRKIKIICLQMAIAILFVAGILNMMAGFAVIINLFKNINVIEANSFIAMGIWDIVFAKYLMIQKNRIYGKLGS